MKSGRLRGRCGITVDRHEMRVVQKRLGFRDSSLRKCRWDSDSLRKRSLQARRNRLR